MPYTATSPTLVLCQQLADAVQAAWNPAAPDAVDWAFFVRYGDVDGQGAPPLVGRQVTFFPTKFGWEPETRQTENYTHYVSCLVAERYADAAGDATRDWAAERADFVHEQIVVGLRFLRGGPPTWNPLLMTLAAEAEVLDVSKLVGGGKLFYALVELEFMELVF